MFTVCLQTNEEPQAAPQYRCGGLGECQGHIGFGEDRGGGRGSSCWTVSYRSNYLALGVEEQLWRHGLDLQALSW